MKKFFSNAGIWLLGIAAALAVLLCVLSSFGGADLLHNAAGIITYPFRSAAAAVSGWVGGVADRFGSVKELQQENDALRQEVARLEEEVRQARSDSEENERLRSLLNLRQQRRDFVFESARVIERSTTNWSSTLTLSKGSQFDIAEGDCAVDANGYLVGVVTEVGWNWCTVTTVLDTGSHLGSLVFRTGEAAVAEGDLSLMPEGKLKLSYLMNSEQLINGDLVVTSGLGGYYPSGLVIGSVDEIRTDEGGVTRYAVLSPHAEISALTEVFIIKDFEIVE